MSVQPKEYINVAKIQAAVLAFQQKWLLDASGNKLSRAQLEANLTIDKYCMGKGAGFCYELEQGEPYFSLGQAGAPNSHGIVFGDANKIKNKSYGKTLKNDGIYVWRGNLGNSAKEAFKKIQKQICDLIEAIWARDYAAIENNACYENVKMRLMFYCQDWDKIPLAMPIWTKELLQTALKCLGLHTDKDAKWWAKVKYTSMQKELVDSSKAHNVQDLCEYYKNTLDKKLQAQKTSATKSEDSSMTSAPGKETLEKSAPSPEAQLVLEHKNVIFTGAPGTGKTHMAREIAEELTKNNSGLTTGKSNDEYVEFCQFHPSYDYTDFVEGLRPVPPDSTGNIGFRRKNGTFKDFCKRAADNLNEYRKSKEKLNKEQARQTQFLDRLQTAFTTYIYDKLKQDKALKGIQLLKNMRIHRIGKYGSVIIWNGEGAEEPTAKQSLSWTIIRRDYEEFKAGNIKSYMDIKPTGPSESEYHGNAAYYFKSLSLNNTYFSKNNNTCGKVEQ